MSDKKKQILSEFERIRDEHYRQSISEETKGEEKNEESINVKKKIFNLVVHIMFGENQTKAINSFNIANNDNNIIMYDDMVNLIVDNVKLLCDAVFVKVEKIYDKLHVIDKKNDTSTLDVESSSIIEKNIGVLSTDTTEKNGLVTNPATTTTHESITTQQTTQNDNYFNGGSFSSPPPSSKKYKLIKK